MKIQTKAKISALVLLSVFALASASPATAFAKNNNSHGKGHGVSVSQNVKVNLVKAKDNDNDGDNDVNEHKSTAQNSVNTESCWRAFGHFIAPGWIKHNGILPVNTNCFLPFGIAKKLGFRNGTTTPPVVDTTAPVITGIVVNTGVNNATVNWHTNESADSKVYWSTVNPAIIPWDINASTTSSLASAIRVSSHQLNITGLSASTTYFAVVASKDSSGNLATSSQFSFTTQPVVVIPDTTAPTFSSVVAVVGTSTINVAWMTNENATGRVYYSTSSPVATSTASFVENTGLSTSHLLNVSGLATSTAYHIILESKDSSGNVGLTTEFSATTGM